MSTGAADHISDPEPPQWGKALSAVFLGLPRTTTWAPVWLSDSEGLKIPNGKGGLPAFQGTDLAAAGQEQKGADNHRSQSQ